MLNARKNRVVPARDSLSTWLANTNDASPTTRLAPRRPLNVFTTAKTLPSEDSGGPTRVTVGAVHAPTIGRKSHMIAGYLQKEKSEGSPLGHPVGQDLIRLNLMVTRGPHWCWDHDDGGEGSPGVVLMFERKNRTATVFWHSTGVVRSCYRFGKFQDLALLIGSGQMYTPLVSECPSPKTRSKWGRVRTVVHRLSAVSTFVSVASGQRTSALRRLGDDTVSESVCTGDNDESMSVQNIPDSPGCSPKSFRSGLSSFMMQRNSQLQYADRDQTAIIFDWDDTLFPTTYAFEAHDGPKLKLMPMQKQAHLSNPSKTQAGRNLMRCAMRAEQLIRLAGSLGRVVIATLAEDGWIDSVCRYFFPGVAKALEELNVRCIYAKDLLEDGEASRAPSPDTEEGRVFWSRVKGKAVSQELNKIYSQYEGQSWKNVLSIGDAEFERLGTRLITAEYQEEHRQASLSKTVPEGEKTRQQIVNVRTKTFKMIDKPMIDELEAQHALLLKWLPLLVKVDGHFDASLNDTDDVEEVNAIAEELQRRQPKEDEMKSERVRLLSGRNGADEDPRGVTEPSGRRAKDEDRSQTKLPDPPLAGRLSPANRVAVATLRAKNEEIPRVTADTK